MATAETSFKTGYKTLAVSSPAFSANGLIPSKYSCDSVNCNPPLDILHIPKEAKSLAIIVDDPDAPRGTWVHWVVWNIPVTTTIEENIVPGEQGTNDFHQSRYDGPCPPSGTHRYSFKIYALNQELDLKPGSTKAQLEKAMSNYIIGYGELVGLYKKTDDIMI